MPVNTTAAIQVMNADYKILLDANVIANFAVCDFYLRMAEKPRMIIPKWSEKILDEVYSTHIKQLGWSTDLANSFQRVLREEFPDAIISGYDELIPLMTNDPKDRHVLAAAVREKLDVIITFNLRDFKSEDLEKWGVRALHPQDYLLILYSMNPQVVIMKLNQIARKKQAELQEVIISFGTSLPAFSMRLLEDMGI